MAMKEREYLNAILAIEGISEALTNETNARLVKLDERREKKKNTQTKLQKENEPIAQGILAALANGAMVSVDLATTLNQTVNKINGVALNLVNEGKLTKTKVKVKGRGDLTSYSLVVTVEDEGVNEEANTDTASTEETAETAED